jgi:hypothetical protein
VAPAANTDVVGSVNGSPITFDQLIARMQRDNPTALDQAVGQAVGAQIVKEALNGSGKAVITRAEIKQAIFTDTPAPVYGELSNLLNEEALTQAAKKADITVTDKQVKDRLDLLLDRMHKSNAIPPGVSNEQFLAERHLTMPQVLGQVRVTLLLAGLVHRDAAGTLGHPIGPGDFVSAHHILIQTKQPGPNAKPEDAKKEDSDALAKITAIRNDIVAGKKTFEDAAKENSEDPSNKASGGDLGVFMRGSMVTEFDTAAFSLKPGEISQPVKTTYGYHLIRVDKLGKDLTQTQRDDAQERYDTQHQQQVAMKIIQGSQIKNNLKQPAQPAMPGMGGRPMPGGRPGMIRPGPGRPGGPPPGNTPPPQH